VISVGIILAVAAFVAAAALAAAACRLGRPRAGVCALVAAQLATGAAPVAADPLPTDTIMNAFVKIEPGQAQLVVRLPLDLVRGLPFPLKDTQYDVAASAPATQLALLTLSDGFFFFENGARLKSTAAHGRLSPLSDRSFENYESALAVADRPSDSAAAIPYDQGYFDLHFTYPISSPGSVFKIQTLVAANLGSLAKLWVRYLPLGESSRAMIIAGGSEPVPLNPSWYTAAGSFVKLGIQHILSGIDHLLFLFCLVIPFFRPRGLIAVITAFTLAHSVTLFASALQLTPQGAWFPPFVETAIAFSILYMALENLVGPNLRRRWLITGIFGLVHGFGFADTLKEQLQFAGSYLLVSLLSFNVGIEIGQLIVLAIMLPALALVRLVVPRRASVMVLSAVAALVAAKWMIERWLVLWGVLRQAGWLHLDALERSGVARWVVGLLLIGVVTLLMAYWRKRKMIAPAAPSQSVAAPADPLRDRP
jgi:hypothetical protein